MPICAELNQSLERIESLPAMPIIAQKLLALPLDTSEGEAELLKLIAQDPQVSAKIIGLSNTALFGSPGKITSVQDAAMRLGLSRVKSVAIGIATMSALATSSEGALKSTDLWIHNMAIAIAVRIIVKYMPANLRPRDDQIFLAGLLHDIGYNVLDFLDADKSNTLHEKLGAGLDTSLLETEHDLLGSHHGEIGAQLGIYWGLPEEIIAVMRYHHTPKEAEADVGQPLVSLVNCAEKLLPDFGITELTAAEVTEQEWIDLGVDISNADKIIEEIGTVAEEAEQLASAG